MGGMSGAVRQHLRQTLERRRAVPLWHPVRMEWHWGNIGSFLAGLSTVLIAVAALRSGPAAIRDWRARQRAEAEALHEEAENIRLERRRYLSGWSPGGVATYEVTLVTQAAELARAGHQLTRDLVNSPYVVLRVSEGGAQHDATRAENLRQLIKTEHHISRPPTSGEVEALEKGLEVVGIRPAVFGRKRRDVATSGAEDTGSPASG